MRKLQLQRRVVPLLAFSAVSVFAHLAVAQTVQAPARLWSVGPLVQMEPTNEVAFGSGGPKLSAGQLGSQTGSIFAATRSVVFAGDRVVLAVRVGMRRIEGAQVAATVFRLLSLDLLTGTVKNEREIVAFGSLPVFATHDGHVLVCGRTVLRLTPELQDAGTFDYEAKGHRFGRIQNVSPDGSTAGNATSPGFELVNLSTLEESPLTTEPSVDSSVNSKGFVTDNRHYVRDYPKDIGFVSYTDAAGDHLLYHGRCGGMPRFLSDELILEPGCKSPLVINTSGVLIKKLDISKPFSFAGTSQNGKRFALQVTDSTHASDGRERFVIYSLETWQRIAEVVPDEPAEEQSWTAFSPDGSMFVVGSPVRLVLYKLP